MTIEDILNKARMLQASDVHISQGAPISLRIHGRLQPASFDVDPSEIKGLIMSICNDRHKQLIGDGYDADFSLETALGYRHRVNVYRHRNGIAAAIRLLNDHIPNLEELRLPSVLSKLASEPRGLILVTGPTGSGKSTTLAAMIDYITKNRASHIITIEDPVEYVFTPNKSIVHQREVGENVNSFASALRSSLREDPDVILVGEMRDYETISTAVTAAETGHLVLSTLHTIGAAQTLDRIIDTCPPEGQRQMRSQLSTILRSVITQQLIPTLDGNGRIAATEILIGTDAVCNLIRENKAHMLGSVMQSSTGIGMRTLNASLAELVRKGTISRQIAEQYTIDKTDLAQYLG